MRPDGTWLSKLARGLLVALAAAGPVIAQEAPAAPAGPASAGPVKPAPADPPAQPDWPLRRFPKLQLELRCPASWEELARTKTSLRLAVSASGRLSVERVVGERKDLADVEAKLAAWAKDAGWTRVAKPERRKVGEREVLVLAYERSVASTDGPIALRQQLCVIPLTYQTIVLTYGERRERFDAAVADRVLASFESPPSADDDEAAATAKAAREPRDPFGAAARAAARRLGERE